MTEPALPFRVAALYRFTPFSGLDDLRASLDAQGRAAGVKGTLLLAPEGLNGTIAGTDTAIEQMLQHIRALPGCADLVTKDSRAATMPFYRMKVRIKREIVTMGQPDIDPVGAVGRYVPPQNWNALVDDPGTILIDTRNDYEVAIGSFRGAIDPRTKSFRDFPQWFEQNRAALTQGAQMPKIAMFCTGGIRCEKSTAYLKQQGLDEVYHLQGGILSYLEQVPPEDSRWDGQCFVFDERVSVGHGLAPGDLELCRACRMPVGDAERASPLFARGVSCPACHATRSDEQRARYAERHRQAALAAARGEPHVGAKQPGNPADAVDQRDDADPVLYSFRRCPYAMRARMALQVSGITVEHREVLLRDKPPEMLAASPKGTVPVLVPADGPVVEESIDIMRWALARNDPESWLEGEDAALIAANDGPFKHHLDRYKYDTRHDSDPDFHRAEGAALLGTLERRLAAQPYLCGAQRTLTDIALFPFVRQFAATDKIWFAGQPLPRVQAWLKGLIASDLFAAIMVKRDPWRADG